MESRETPLIRQYNSIKAKYHNAILLFRVGDFYESFGPDAVVTSQILNIILTKTSKNSGQQQLAGFHYHCLESYLPKLVKAGHRVAIYDQLQYPKSVKYKKR